MAEPRLGGRVPMLVLNVYPIYHKVTGRWEIVFILVNLHNYPLPGVKLKTKISQTPAQHFFNSLC